MNAKDRQMAAFPFIFHKFGKNQNVMSNIKLFESKEIRSTWNELEQKWYFSVQDVVGVLTESADVKQYIKKMLSRDPLLKSNWGTICTLVEMQAAGGKIPQKTTSRKERTNQSAQIKSNDALLKPMPISSSPPPLF